MTLSSTGTIILLLCLCLSSPVAAQLSPALSVVHVPLSATSDNQRYFTNVNMSFGPQTQRFGFALSTTTGYTIVAAASCPNCTSNNIPTYNASLSTSATTIDSGQKQQTVLVAGGTVNAGSGITSKEDCGLRQVNGSFWVYRNGTIIQSNSSSIFQSGISGLIGLGANTADFRDTIFAEWLSNNPTLSNFTFGLALNPLPEPHSKVSSSGGDGASEATGSAGTLHLQQPDPSAYTGEIQWQNVQNIVPGSNGSANSSGVIGENLVGSSWLIQMDGWTFTAAGRSARISNSQVALAAVEPYFPNIFLPQAHAIQIYASQPGSAPLPVSPSDVGQAYSIPCDADITFSVLLSGNSYLLPKETLVIRAADGSCIGAIEGWTDPTATNCLLGSRFISTLYIVFQIGQLPGAQQQVGIAQRALSPAKHPNAGKIAGGVVGGLGFLMVIGGVAFWWFQRRRKASSVAGAGKEDIKPLRSEKPAAEILGYTIDPWTPSPISNLSSPTLNSPSPSSADRTSFPTINSQAGTKASQVNQLPEPDSPSSPLVKQWVTNRSPTNASYSPTSAVSTHFDYGNAGKPATLVSPASLEGVGSEW